MRKNEMKSEELYKYALLLEEQRKYPEAVKIYKKLVSLENDPRYFIAFGVCLQQLGHWQESVQQLEIGLSLKPHYCEGDARLFLAESYLKLGKEKKAIEQWRIVEKMKPEYPSYEKVPDEAKSMLEKYA